MRRKKKMVTTNNKLKQAKRRYVHALAEQCPECGHYHISKVLFSRSEKMSADDFLKYFER
jgi:hypothetical protein